MGTPPAHYPSQPNTRHKNDETHRPFVCTSVRERGIYSWWHREHVWSAAKAGFCLCSNAVWQRSLTHRRHCDGGERFSLLWQREHVWSAQARGFCLCSNAVWQRSLTHRRHRDGGERFSLLWQREHVWSAAQAVSTVLLRSLG